MVCVSNCTDLFVSFRPPLTRQKGQPMKTNKNQKSTREYKVYIHRFKTWVEVTEEQYYTYYRDIWATRKRTQAHGQCMCPKSKTWMCDGNCLACEFRAAGDNLLRMARETRKVGQMICRTIPPTHSLLWKIANCSAPCIRNCRNSTSKVAVSVN